MSKKDESSGNGGQHLGIGSKDESQGREGGGYKVKERGYDPVDVKPIRLELNPR